MAQTVKNPPANTGDPGSIPGSGRSPGGGNGSPLQYSCLENPMDRGAWWATVHGVAELDTLCKFRAGTELASKARAQRLLGLLPAPGTSHSDHTGLKFLFLMRSCCHILLAFCAIKLWIPCFSLDKIFTFKHLDEGLHPLTTTAHLMETHRYFKRWLSLWKKKKIQ